MAGLLDIYNMALGAVGTRTTIADPNEPSNEARQCNVFYNQALEEVLQAAYWNFAQRTEYLALFACQPWTPEGLAAGATNTAWLRTNPSPPWLYAYVYPADCVQMRFIVAMNGINQAVPGTPMDANFTGPFRYRTGTMVDAASNLAKGVILTDASQAIACYTALITDPAQMGAQFVASLVQRLAAYIALPLTGDLKIEQKCLKVYAQTLQSAMVSDANEGYTLIDFTPESLQSRGFGGSYNTQSGLKGTI